MLPDGNLILKEPIARLMLISDYFGRMDVGRVAWVWRGKGRGDPVVSPLDLDSRWLKWLRLARTRGLLITVAKVVKIRVKWIRDIGTRSNAGTQPYLGVISTVTGNLFIMMNWGETSELLEREEISRRTKNQSKNWTQDSYGIHTTPFKTSSQVGLGTSVWWRVDEGWGWVGGIWAARWQWN